MTSSRKRLPEADGIRLPIACVRRETGSFAVDHSATSAMSPYPTRTFRSLIGEDGGTDDRFARAVADGFGAFILGRNMFGPIRGEWPDDAWKGWWGDNPPYHAPTFILTHHARPPIVMEGGTTFHFVTDGIEAALAQAKGQRATWT